MYFDPLQLEWPLVEALFGNPGISVAFFGMKTDGTELERLGILSVLANGRKVDDAIIRAFIDQSLLNEAVHGFLGGIRLEAGGPETNPSAVAYVLDQLIVIENSPPEGVPFASLIKGASAATIGAYVGVHAADGNLLLFLTVPAGILVVGSAIAVTNAINQGLNKAVERISKRKPGRRK
ncbi:MAG: hypothetical protein P4M07_15695 [Xanthobacteraceae bacterium]|nr:hypothetical protein [Xanthobacteraceae bacterium]